MNLKIPNLELPEPQQKWTLNLPNQVSSSDTELRTSKPPKKDRTSNRTKCFYFIKFQKMGKFFIWYWNEPENYEPPEPRFVLQN